MSPSFLIFGNNPPVLLIDFSSGRLLPVVKFIHCEEPFFVFSFSRSLMATDTRTRRALDARSGGKTMKSHRVMVSRTPYDRSNPLPRADESRSPGWLSGLIFPATRKIACGAGKLLYTVFGAEGSSSSESSSFETESSFDDCTEYVNDETACSLEGTELLNEVDGKNKTKIEIEQMIMKETFSRKECDRLIEIIKSRVVNKSSTEMDREILDMRNRAILEARRWIEEKRFGSPSSSKFNQVASAYNSTSPCGLDSQTDSPVDLAKSYIMARPPWSSPLSNLNYSSSEIGNSLKALPHMSVRSGSLSNSKRKTDSLSSGSWNIVEEMRKFRSKATDDILKSFPSTTANLQICSAEKNEKQNSFIDPILPDFAGTGSLNLDASRLNSVDTSPNMAGVVDRGIQVENGVLESLSLPTVSYSSSHQVMEIGQHPVSESCLYTDKIYSKQQTSGTEFGVSGPPVVNVTVNREASLDMIMDGHDEDTAIGDWSPGMADSAEANLQQQQQQQQKEKKPVGQGRRSRGRPSRLKQ